MTQQPEIEGFRRYIEEALQYAGGTHTFEDVRAAVADGRMQLWPGVHSVVITEIITYPQYKALNFFLAGGERNSLAEFEAMEPLINAWGHAQGCRVACFTGRRGWERTFLSRTGWRSSLVVLEKSLDGEEGRRHTGRHSAA